MTFVRRNGVFTSFKKKKISLRVTSLKKSYRGKMKHLRLWRLPEVLLTHTCDPVVHMTWDQNPGTLSYQSKPEVHRSRVSVA